MILCVGRIDSQFVHYSQIISHAQWYDYCIIKLISSSYYLYNVHLLQYVTVLTPEDWSNDDKYLLLWILQHILM